METHSVRIVPTGEDGEIVVYSGESHMSSAQVTIAYDTIGWCCSNHDDDDDDDDDETLLSKVP